MLEKLSRKYRLLFLIFGFLSGYSTLHAQVQTLETQDTNTVRVDTLPNGRPVIRISNDGIDEVVEYGARDSMWFDVLRKQVHLYGNAKVSYGRLNISAGYILLDYAKNEISAEQFPDSLGKLQGTPKFKDNIQDVSAQKLRYNFKTKKGVIYEARTQQDDLYVIGDRAKIIGSTDKDTTNQRAKTTIYNADAIITTCDAPHPHFGIHTQKLKVIPDKLVVTGLSNVEIMGIPTPLVL
ncbi:MAG: hypothetical protein KGS48_09665, partial [Bacteroidetes bacterium]|nr:hypothetical protein [Bacteroidota bacterium]